MYRKKNVPCSMQPLSVPTLNEEFLDSAQVKAAWTSLFEAVKKTPIVVTSGGKTVLGPNGPAWRALSVAYAEIPHVAYAPPPFSLFVVCRKSANISEALISFGGSGAGGGWSIQSGGTVQDVLITYGGVATYAGPTGFFYIAADAVYAFVVSASEARFFRDGVFMGSCSVGTPTTPSKPLTIGAEHDGTNYIKNGDSRFAGGLLLNTDVSDARVFQISKRFWNIFIQKSVVPLPVTVTAQFLRPISDVSNSGWTPSTGSDLFACIGEAVRNDTTYISATAPGAICETLLGTSSGDPLSSINHLPRIVMSAGSGGIIVRLKQGATVIKAWTYASLTGTDTLYEPTLTSGEIDSITDYTDLRLQLETTA